MISIQEFVLGLGFLQPTTHKHVSIQIYTKFHTFLISLSSYLLFFFSSSSSSSLFSLAFTVFFSLWRPNLVLNPTSLLRPCFAPKNPFFFWVKFPLFHFSPSIPFFLQIKLDIILFLAYKLFLLCHLYPILIIYMFALVPCTNFRVFHFISEKFHLAYNIP